MSFVKFAGHFTCDNSYAVWVGNAVSVRERLIEATNKSASGIKEGEAISGSAKLFDYLYLLAWSDDSNYQGLLGVFDAGTAVLTGDPRWEVLPTGNNKSNDEFPSRVEINSALATAAAVDWSKPWVGPDNHQVGPWGTIANIPKSARWTWHDSGKQKAGKTPLEGGFNHDEFLIFRIPIRYLLPDTLTISNVVEAGCCTVATVVECNCDHVGEAPVDDDPQHDENEPSDTTDIMAEIFATEGIELSDDEHACVMEILSGTFSPDEIRQNLKSPTDEFHKFLLGAVEKCRD